VIGCDVGSQGTNAALYSADGTLLAQAYQRHQLSFPRPAWAEQNPADWIRALHATIATLLKHVPEGPSAVAALSFGSQLDGLVICDPAGHPLRPAIIWMDRRAEPQATGLARLITPADFYQQTGVNLDSSHAVFKALWVRDNEPDTFAAAAALMPPGSYLLRQAAGVLAVDHSNASSLGLLDPRSRTWSAPVLGLTGLDTGMLPELTASTEPVGTITAAFADTTGLRPGTLVVTGCGDEMAATLGAGVRDPGEICDVAGTAEPVCAACAEPLTDPTMLVECHPHADPRAWLLENPGFVSGGNLRWWRDQFGAPGGRGHGNGDDYDLMTQSAASIPPGCEGLVFLPCLQGAMAPEWNGAARGAFCGLTLAHTRAHLIRAMLEASAFALRDILTAMRGAGLAISGITAVGGGANSRLWRQIKADATGLPVRVPRNLETTAAGAAVLAATGAGIHPGVAEAVKAMVAYQPEEQQPNPKCRNAYDDAYQRYREAYFALKPVFAPHHDSDGGRNE
jgi:xylulokinase